MAEHFWIAVEWTLAQRESPEWKCDLLRRLGEESEQGGV